MVSEAGRRGMSSGCSDVGELAIPSVTLEDLQQFHSCHFRNEARESGVVTRPDVATTLSSSHLGYYEDGVLRTLTDEQIAIFRHSEIQALLCERRYEAEAAADNDGDDGIVRKQETLTKTGSSGDTAQEPRQKKPKTASYGSTRGKKYAEINGRTHRRVARELDEVKSNDVELDY